MKERPIIFTGESVRAILAGQKTQTRRLINPQPPAVSGVSSAYRYAGGWRFGGIDYRSASKFERCPHGATGDRLWVRETWAPALDFGTDTGSIFYRATYVRGGPCDDVERWSWATRKRCWPRLRTVRVGVSTAFAASAST